MIPNIFFLKPADLKESSETATSKIFLTSEYIYKVKKKVKIEPFLDYTMIENRNYCINKEFRKGKKYSEALYSQQLLLTFEEFINEPAICMYNYNDKRETLYNYLKKREIHDKNMICELLLFVSDFHKKTIRYQNYSNSIYSINERFQMLLEEAASLNLVINHDLKIKILAFSRHYECNIDARFLKGCIRELHGDMHLGNILYDGQEFYLFDFLDFDDKYTNGDYLYDYGFLLADLFFFGAIHLADASQIAESLNESLSYLYFFAAYGCLNRINGFKFDENVGWKNYYQLFDILINAGCKILQKGSYVHSQFF